MATELQNVIASEHVGIARGLFETLAPGAESFCFYDLNRTCVWSSVGSDDFETDNYVADLPGAILTAAEPDSKLRQRTLPSGRTLLILPVYGTGQDGIGLFVAAFPPNAGTSSWFKPDELRKDLEPAVKLLGESAHLQQKLSAAAGRADRVLQELKLLYQIDEKIHGASKRHASLAQLVGQSGRFLEIGYSVLLLPSKRIRVGGTHSAWKHVNRKALDKYLSNSLFPRLKGHRAPVIFEVPAVPGSIDIAEQGFQAMVCPLIDRMGNVEGMLALLGRVNREPFRSSHSRFMSYIVRKVQYVIEQSFDAMTGLMNRSGFTAQANESRETLSGDDDAHQVIYFDLDNLQLVNDTFGEDAGDEVITRFAQVLEENVPDHAVVTRLTGDDFAILLKHCTLDDALRLTALVRENSSRLRYLKGDKSLQITFSAGIAAIGASEAGRPGEVDAVTAARIACDSAKDHGRDRTEVYDQDDQSIVRRYDDMNLVAEIQKALDADGFELMAQPIVSLTRPEQHNRYEVLLRMKDSTGNKITSSAFFSAAERYQIMPQIDRWVVSTTLRKLSTHAGFLKSTEAIFAINLSGQSLGDDGILSFIEGEIESSGVPANALCFEVTESAAVSNRTKAQAFIDALRERGCKFSLDDFGAGLSSFTYLKNFKVDTLKIDGSFIRDITENRISESMVAAITQVAKVMELETVAEYVESEQCQALIAKLGVDYAQGHVIGKPIPLDDVLDDMSERPGSSTA